MAKITIGRKDLQAERRYQVRVNRATHEKVVALSRKTGYAMREIVEMAMAQVQVRVGRSR